MDSNILFLAIAILIVIVVIYFLTHKRYSTFNTSPVSVCGKNNSGKCTEYNVHNLHHDRKKAAELIDDITKKVDKLMQHLKSKYTNSAFRGGLDPSKENRIDVIPVSNVYLDANALNDVSNSDYIQERVEQLFDRYDKNSIYEISPMNKSNLTSYTENKGEQLILCLRKKHPNIRGYYELHDKNTMMFVVVHELTHIMNDTWGHKKDFWKLFDFMLENAVEAGVYVPVNYAVHSIDYCGLRLNYNPLFDPSL